MPKVLFTAATITMLSMVTPSPAFAKGKKAKKPAATMEALPPRVVIYDPNGRAAGPATFARAEEPKVPDAPLLTVTTDKEAGMGVAEERDVAIEKGKKK